MQLKKYLIVARPWSFTMSLISVSVGTLLAAETGPVSWPWFFATAVGIVFFHAAANLINDYFDSKNKIDTPDAPTVKYRPQPIVAGVLTPRQVLMGAVFLFALTAVIGLVIAYCRSWHIVWIGVVGLLTAVFYTAGPVGLKYRAFGEIAVFLMWGPLMVEGAYAVQTQTVSLKPLLISIPFGTLVALVLFANNMRDIAFDARQNIKTLSIAVGLEKSMIIFAGLILAAYVYVFGMIVLGMMSLWGLIILLSVPKAWSLLKTFRRKVPDMADALTAQFDTVFGVLLMLALFLDRVVHL
ncbi:MAG: 1,4-dihydroxy-2-naphthoate octaprenyltransferase [Syntrophaceae bacterium]|jgi:1,4-dihydroxy-2-naphthoate octaprenyltransferase|nr:1,4-dihydroxy-2-naphthoate octaprenyltransferase [Syntrophaceae bacterium]